MNKTADITKKVLFKVKWRFMPPQKKYAYLWSKTVKSWPVPGLVRDTDRTDTYLGG